MENTCVGKSFHNNSFAIIEMIMILKLKCKLKMRVKMKLKFSNTLSLEYFNAFVIDIIPMCTIMIPIPPMPFYWLPATL